MEEQILNYLDMSEEQKEKSLRDLKSIGFYPAYGKEKTMKKIMDKSIAGEMPQFYFVFRKEQLIGYLFIIGDTQKYRAFPWLAEIKRQVLKQKAPLKYGVFCYPKPTISYITTG